MNKILLITKIRTFAGRHNINEGQAWAIFNHTYYEIFKTNLEGLKKRHCHQYGIGFMGLPEFIEEMGLLEPAIVVSSYMNKNI